MRGRLYRYNKPHRLKFVPVISSNEVKKAPTPEQMISILNIHLAAQDGQLKLILESICEDSPRNTLQSLVELLKSVPRIETSPGFNQIVSTAKKDESYYFKVAGPGNHDYVTSAVEFVLPKDNIAAIAEFLRFMDKVAANAKAHVIVGRESILSVFHDFIIANNNPEHKSYLIYKYDIFLLGFLLRDHAHSPDKPSKFLAHGIAHASNIPDYYTTQAFFKHLYPRYDQQALDRPLDILNRLLEVQLTEFFNLNIDQKLRVVRQCEAKLADENIFLHAEGLLRILQSEILNHLLKPCFDKNSKRDQPEIVLLYEADFIMCDDGRLRLQHPKHGLFIKPLQSLLSTLGLEFSSDINLQEELLFTAESSLKLRAWGLHLNSANLRHIFNFSVDNSPVLEAAGCDTDLPTENFLKDSTAKEIISKRPYLSNIVSLAEVANQGHFDKQTFANLVYLYDEQFKKDLGRSLCQIYKLLGSDFTKPCLLTPLIQQQLSENQLVRDNMQTLVQLMNRLPLNTEVLAKFFTDVDYYISFYNLTHHYDANLDGFWYLFVNYKNDDKFHAFIKLLESTANAPWMNLNILKLAIENVHNDECFNILQGMNELHKANLLEWSDRFLQQRRFDISLQNMRYHHCLNNENLALAFTNPDFGKAFNLVEELDLDKVSDRVIPTLLVNHELASAFRLMYEIYCKFNDEELHKDIFKDLLQMMQIVGIQIPEKFKDHAVVNAIKSGFRFFIGEKPPLTLADCVNKARETYLGTHPSLQTANGV